MRLVLRWLALLAGLSSAGCEPGVYPCKLGMPKACEFSCTVKGAPRSCTVAAIMLENGPSRDERKATEFYTRGCLLGDGEACHLGGLQLFLGSKNNELAIRMFDAGCRLSLADSCAMGAAVRASLGAPPKETAELLWYACKSGSATGCILLGERHLAGEGVSSSKIEARRLFDRACTLGDPDGCALSKANAGDD